MIFKVVGRNALLTVYSANTMGSGRVNDGGWFRQRQPQRRPMKNCLTWQISYGRIAG